MKLKEAKLRKTYNVTDIQFCNDCTSIDHGSCMILSLMEKGLVPGCELEVLQKDLGLYRIRIDDGTFVIRRPEAERFNIEVE